MNSLRSIRSLPLLGLAGVLAILPASTFAAEPASKSTPVDADALINKLVQKGILTTQEAGELKQEAQKNPALTDAAKSSMPEWVKSFKLNGDFRGRYDGSFISNPAGFDRNRFRYRLRVGATAVLLDDFEIGLRLSSADASGTFGGNPISANTTFQDNGAKKGVYLDLAYARWSPLHTEDLSGSVTFGKMLSPFTYSEMVFDNDYTPEGIAAQFAYKLNPDHTLKFTAGAFVLDELSLSSADPYFAAVQMRFDSDWTKKLQTSIGAGVLGVSNADQLLNGSIPNVNRGNTRNAAGAPAASFNPVVVDASVVYKFPHIPGYAGEFPLKVGGDYMNNLAASKKSQGVSGIVTFGKAGKKGLWEITYNYRRWSADMWFEELVDDDFGGFYQSTAGLNSGTANASEYGGGTNIRGHVVRASYSPFNSLTLTISWYQTELIDKYPSGSDSDASRFQMDMVWKF